MLLLLYVAVITPALWITDLRQRRLPNVLVLPGYGVATVSLALQWVFERHPPLTALVSGAAYFGFLFLLGLFGGMGGGDVKLAGVLGLAAGAVSATAAAVSPVAAFLLGGVAAVVAVARRQERSIPFGPFMLSGFWIAIVLALVSPGGSST